VQGIPDERKIRLNAARMHFNSIWTPIIWARARHSTLAEWRTPRALLFIISRSNDVESARGSRRDSILHCDTSITSNEKEFLRTRRVDVVFKRKHVPKVSNNASRKILIYYSIIYIIEIFWNFLFTNTWLLWIDYLDLEYSNNNRMTHDWSKPRLSLLLQMVILQEPVPATRGRVAAVVSNPHIVDMHPLTWRSQPIPCTYPTTPW